MTPEQIEEWRKAYVKSTADVDEIADLALDGLRFRKWVEATNTTPTKLATLLGYCETPETYRMVIDKFVVERAA